MALSSRKKRRAFRNPKRVRRGGSTGFNVAVAAIVILGSVLVLASRHPNSAGAVGPKLKNAQGVADHWHAAIGVNVCGVWQPAPIWQFSSAGSPVRSGTTIYAGLHSHILSNKQGDGIIHLEPSTSDEAGRNATVGKWVEFGGWHLDSSSMSLWAGADGKPITEHNGDKCPGNKTAKLRWAVGQFHSGQKTKLVEQKGDPADLKLYDQDVVAIYFVPSNQNLAKLGAVPSEGNLPGAANREGSSSTPTTMPNSAASSTVPGSPTTVKPGTATSTTVTPTSGASTTTPTTNAATSTTPTT